MLCIKKGEKRDWPRDRRSGTATPKFNGLAVPSRAPVLILSRPARLSPQTEGNRLLHSRALKAPILSPC